MDIMTSMVKEPNVQQWLVLGMVEGRSGTAARMEKIRTEGQRTCSSRQQIGGHGRES